MVVGRGKREQEVGPQAIWPAGQQCANTNKKVGDRDGISAWVVRCVDCLKLKLLTYLKMGSSPSLELVTPISGPRPQCGNPLIVQLLHTRFFSALDDTDDVEDLRDFQFGVDIKDNLPIGNIVHINTQTPMSSIWTTCVDYYCMPVGVPDSLASCPSLSFCL